MTGVCLPDGWVLASFVFGRIGSLFGAFFCGLFYGGYGANFKMGKCLIDLLGRTVFNHNFFS